MPPDVASILHCVPAVPFFPRVAGWAGICGGSRRGKCAQDRRAETVNQFGIKQVKNLKN